MRKRILALPTDFYQTKPTWLVVPMVLLMAMFFPILGSFLAGVPLGIVLAFCSRLIEGFDAIAFAQVLLSEIHVELAIFAVTAFCLCAWVFFVEKRSIRSLGFFKGHISLEIVKGWGLGTLLLLLSFGAIYLTGGLTFVSVDWSWATLLFVLSLIPFWFLQGGTEELVTRGWLLPILAKKTNLAFAFALSSSIFGLMHLGNSHVTLLSILSIILSGILMGLYMLKTDNIWGVAGLHGAWNFTQGNLIGVAVSGQGSGASILRFETKEGVASWLSGGEFGIEGSFLTCLVLFLAIVVLRLQMKKDEVD